MFPLVLALDCLLLLFGPSDPSFSVLVLVVVIVLGVLVLVVLALVVALVAVAVILVVDQAVALVLFPSVHVCLSALICRSCLSALRDFLFV